MFIGIQGPPGATMADMHRVAGQTTAMLREQVPEMDMAFTQVGSVAGEGFGGGGSGGPSSGTITVVLKDKRAATVSQIEDRIRRNFRDDPRLAGGAGDRRFRRRRDADRAHQPGRRRASTRAARSSSARCAP